MHDQTQKMQADWASQIKALQGIHKILSIKKTDASDMMRNEVHVMTHAYTKEATSANNHNANYVSLKEKWKNLHDNSEFLFVNSTNRSFFDDNKNSLFLDVKTNSSRKHEKYFLFAKPILLQHQSQMFNDGIYAVNRIDKLEKPHDSFLDHKNTSSKAHIHNLNVRNLFHI